MAEGGDFAYEDEDLDDDDEEVNTIRPFQPGAASTPYQRGDQYEMQTMQHEQSGLPSYDETTPLISDEDIQRRLGFLREDLITGLLDTTKMDPSVNPLSKEDKAVQIQKVRDFIQARYPNADLTKLPICFSFKKPMDIVVLGPKSGETKIILDNGSDFQKSFLNLTFAKRALG